MNLSTYLEVLRVKQVRNALLLGLLIRVPMWAGAVLVSVHVVSHLERTYAQAGLIGGAASIAVAVSGPWRGSKLDKFGLRRAVWPSLVVNAIAWTIAPWVGYWLLMAMVIVSGLFVVPTYSILRQVVISHVPEEQRKSALVLDAVFMEFSFMLGPIAGVLLAHKVDTPLALMIMELLSVLGGLLLWWINPPMGQDEDQRGERVPLRTWMSPSVIAILAAAGAAVLVLSGTDLSIVAAVRSMQVPTLLGLMMAVWGAGSAVGGLVYGATTRHPPLMILLGLLGATTALVALAPGLVSFGVLTFLCGAFCAPTMTAGLDALTREVPVAVRGEAMGWHSSLATGGASLGAPLVGLAIDGAGWQGGFVSAGDAGKVIAAIGLWIAPRTGAEHVEGLLSAEEVEARALGQA